MKKLLLAVAFSSACALPIVEHIPTGYGDFIIAMPEKDALVGVDEGLVGTIGDFDSKNHPLRLAAGPHVIVIAHPDKGRCVIRTYAVSGKRTVIDCAK